MVLFWGIFHDTYVGRDIDPHSAYWCRWRHDRRIELEHIICHSPICDDKTEGNYLEKYLDYIPSQLGYGSSEDQEFYKKHGEKVSKFEMSCMGIEKCNPEWNDGITSNKGSKVFVTPECSGRVSSPRLSVDFAIPGLSYNTHGPRSSIAALKNQAHQVPSGRSPLDHKRRDNWESKNQSMAFGILAERRNRALSDTTITLQRSLSDLKVKRGANSIHGRESVWEEAKSRFLPHSINQRNKKPVVSAPMSITRGPHLSMKLNPITHPAPELMKQNRTLVSIQESSTCSTTMPSSSENLSTIAYVGEPLSSVLPQCIQGSLYGQMEDILVDSVNTFLKSQFSKVSSESIRRSMPLKRPLSCVEPITEKKWLQTMLRRIPSLSKKKNGVNSNDIRHLTGHQWGICAGFKLLEANISVLDFYGPYAHPNPENPRKAILLCNKLIQEAFSGNRTRFEDDVIVEHLETVEMVLSLLGNTSGLRAFRKRKYEALSLVRKGWKGGNITPPVVPKVHRPDTQEELQPGKPFRSSIPRLKRLPPLRSSSLPRSTSTLISVSTGSGSYLEEEAHEFTSVNPDSPSIGRGKSKDVDDLRKENQNFVDTTPMRALRSFDPNRAERKRAQSLQALIGTKDEGHLGSGELRQNGAFINST
ncbi:hypothetical protein DFH27DRAFT_602145 [Peziza echinospora]|nr:hypothetical protein DFH27DRAFT_602145 [Peziza echinospora]